MLMKTELKKYISPCLDTQMLETELGFAASGNLDDLDKDNETKLVWF